jgi:hypothetical protein
MRQRNESTAASVSRRSLMRRIRETGKRELIWAQTDLRGREYELRACDEVVGRLRRCGGLLAVAEAAGGSWSFERSGLLNPRVNVGDLETGTGIATFGYGWTGDGTLEMSRGGRFRWTAANLWRSRWEWRRADGTSLARFEGRQGLVKIEGRVEIEQAAPDLLVLLGWYLVMMRARDSASDAAATTITVS